MDKKDDYMVGGTVHPSSYKYCIPMPGIGTKAIPTGSYEANTWAKDGPIDKFARMAYSTIGRYMWDNYS